MSYTVAEWQCGTLFATCSTCISAHAKNANVRGLWMLGRDTADSCEGGKLLHLIRDVSVEERTAMCTCLFMYFLKKLFSQSCFFACVLVLFCQEHYSRFKEKLWNSEVGDRKLNIVPPSGCICGRSRRACWSNISGWPIHLPGGTETWISYHLRFLKIWCSVSPTELRKIRWCFIFGIHWYVCMFSLVNNYTSFDT